MAARQVAGTTYTDTGAKLEQYGVADYGVSGKQLPNKHVLRFWGKRDRVTVIIQKHRGKPVKEPMKIAFGASRPTADPLKGLPTILHYDGSAWNYVPAPNFPDFPSPPSAYNLTSTSFGPPDNPINRSDGWAVGFDNTFDAVALHWDGVSWRVQTGGLQGPNAGAHWSTFMVSSTDVWAVGQVKGGGSGVFWHWTGVADGRQVGIYAYRLKDRIGPRD